VTKSLIQKQHKLIGQCENELIITLTNSRDVNPLIFGTTSLSRCSRKSINGDNATVILKTKLLNL